MISLVTAALKAFTLVDTVPLYSKGRLLNNAGSPSFINSCPFCFPKCHIQNNLFRRSVQAAVTLLMGEALPEPNMYFIE